MKLTNNTQRCEDASQFIAGWYGWDFKYSKGKGKYMKLKIVLEPQEEGGYTVYVPSLPGCISQGETYEEALENIKEAIELYLEPDEDELLQYPQLKVMEVMV